MIYMAVIIFQFFLEKVDTDNHVDLLPQYNVKKANWSKFRDLCIQEFKPDLAQDPDHINIFTDGIKKIMDQTIPLSKPNGKRPKPWFNKDVQDACKNSKSGKYNQAGYKHLINEQGKKVTSKREIVKDIAEGFAQSSSSDNYSDEFRNIKNIQEQQELDF